MIKVKMLGLYSFFMEDIINSFLTKQIIITVRYYFKTGIPENSGRKDCNFFASILIWLPVLNN